MERLLLAPKPLEDESLAGYILRITDYNGYENSSWIYTMAQIKKKKIVRGDAGKISLELLSNITGITERELWSMTFNDKIMDTTNVRFIRTGFKLGINLYADKICPACFNENFYQKKIWNYTVNVICPIHNLYLVNECPRCNNKISSIRKTLKKCNCGFELKLLDHVKVEEDCISFVQFFYNLYYEIKTFDTQIDAIWNLKFVELINLMITIWLRIGGYNKEKRPIVDFSMQNEVEKKIILQIYEIFTHWPHKFYAFLDKIYIRGEGLSKAFGRFYKDLTKKYECDSFGFLRYEFWNFINDNWHKPVELGKKDLYNNEFVSGEQAMKVLEIDRRVLNYLISKGILESKTSKRGYVHTSIKTATLSKYLIRKKDYLFTTQVIELLGTELPILEILDEQGYIKRITDLEGLRKRKIYSKISIKEFLLKMEIYLQETDEITDDLIVFNQALRNIKFSKVELNYFFRAIFEGTLRPKRRVKDRGLRTLLFLKGDIQMVIENYRKDNPKKVILSIKDAAKIIGLRQSVISSWIKRGFLIGNGDSDGKKFALEDIQMFQKNYITLKEIAEKHNTISVYMMKKLSGMGIEPISGINIDGSEGYLYKSEDVKVIL
ncbi:MULTISPECIES: TniQ family protein [Bacillus cereus group]|uniref:TniQ family protein n=1 Tax=Bacillus cereus group TaxID=86661 RepID=UPI001BA7D560